MPKGEEETGDIIDKAEILLTRRISDRMIKRASRLQRIQAKTTGKIAGAALDVFHAGFIYGLLQNWEVVEILRFANAVAALKCRDLGGRRGIPLLEEVQKFLNPP